MDRYFKGFSTRDSHITRQRSFSDIELIRHDLLNHFHTRVGERVMRPTWGCRIWDYVMEPMTLTTRDEISAEARRVCESDSRVRLTGINVSGDDHSVVVEISLIYVPYGLADTFSISFDRRNASVWNV